LRRVARMKGKVEHTFYSGKGGKVKEHLTHTSEACLTKKETGSNGLG